MKLASTTLKQLTITDVRGLDPIRVICENYEPGHGRIIIQCWDEAWAGYWGAMGADRTIERFFIESHADYLAGNLLSGAGLRRNTNRTAYLMRIIFTVQDALRQLMPRETPGRRAKLERLAQANQLIKVISSHGRRFFWNEEGQRVAKLELDSRGRVIWIDDYQGTRVCTSKVCGREHEWRGFSHGGTLKDLVKDLRDFVLHAAAMPRWRIAPSASFSDGDIWGYGDDAAKAVREEAFTLSIFNQAKPS